jgi:hypothetical protein
MKSLQWYNLTSMKTILLISGLILITSTTFAQTPKEARDLNLKTKTSWVTEKKGKKELNYKKFELRFDKDGSLIQEIEFNAKGDIIKNIAYQYENKNKIREIHFDKNGKITLRIEYKFSRKILSEIQHFDEKNELIRKEQFIYEQQD